MSLFDNPQNSLLKAFSAGSEKLTATKVLALPALFQGARLIAGKLGKIPCNFVRRTPILNKIDEQHYGNWLLARPHEHFGKRTLFVVGTLRALLEGNFYAEIIWNDKAEAIKLDPIDNDRVEILMIQGELAYRIDGKRILSADRILHIKNLTHNPYIGLSAIDILFDSLHNSLAMQRYSNKYFRKLANVGWILETPHTMDEEQKQAARKAMEKFQLDSEDSFGLGLAPGGMKLNQVTLDAEKAQLIQSKEFDLITIANVLGLPAHKLGSATGGGYKNLQEMEQSLYDDCISYWCDTWAEELELKILSSYQLRTGSHFVDWDASVLVKADIETQHKMDIENLTNGLITSNELNVMRNRPRIEHPFADSHKMPAQLLFAEQIYESRPSEGKPQPEDDKKYNPNPDVVADDRFEKLLGVTVNRLNTRLRKAYEHAYQKREDVDIEGHASAFAETLCPLGVKDDVIRAYIKEAIKNGDFSNERLRATIQ